MDGVAERVRARIYPFTHARREAVGEAIIRFHVRPYVDSVRLDKLNAMLVQRLYRRKLGEGLRLGTGRSEDTQEVRTKRQLRYRESKDSVF